MLRVKAAAATKQLVTENVDGFSWKGFPWESGGRAKEQQVRTFTSDDVDSSQAVECAHQLSVGFFTLHSTFLLQRLEELLHGHGAAGKEVQQRRSTKKQNKTKHTHTL